MTVVHIPVEQAHAYNLPEEKPYGHVHKAEQEEPDLTEIESQQTVPLDDGQ